MIVYAYIPRAWVVEEGKSRVQAHPHPYNKFEANMGYLRACI